MLGESKNEESKTADEPVISKNNVFVLDDKQRNNFRVLTNVPVRIQRKKDGILEGTEKNFDSAVYWNSSVRPKTAESVAFLKVSIFSLTMTSNVFWDP